jgi:hypothetical protein
MRKTLILISFLFQLNYVFGQILSFEDAQNIEIASQYSNGDTISSFILKDGSKLKVGDKLKIGKPLEPKLFTRLVTGKYNIAKAVLIGPPIQWGVVMIGKELIVSEMKLYHTKLSKKSPLTVLLYVEDPTMSQMTKYSTILDIQAAIETGEVINPNGSLTREQAIAKLKEAKDLLDLGMMKQTEFDTLREKLTPIIKQ